MKVFENIAEYQVFKRKYEMMGQLEEERLREAAEDPKALEDFLIFVDDVRSLNIEPEAAVEQLDDELATDIERQKLLARYPLIKDSDRL
ncbi:MAG TPA: hypothetical protein DCP63_14060 [Bacteroidetes bacterium]|nr:hypothetical protein [Bacteroidota bacterium]